MATSVSGGAPLDLTKSGRYPIVLSKRLLDESDSSGATSASVQLNYQLPLSSIAKTTITPSKSGPDNYGLTVYTPDQHDKYTFTGSQQSSTKCALLFDPTTQSFTLDKIDTQFNFNLRSTPTNKSAKALAAQYPQLETTAPDPLSDEEELFADEAALADPDNPYDYRHYLKRRQSSSPEPIELASRDPSPVLQEKEKPKPKPKPKQTKRPTRPPSKRVASPPPREEADADNEDSDDGGLQIIMDGSTPKPRHRFHTNFNRSGEAPRSLRSAASSVSPALMPQQSSSEESDEDNIKLPPAAVYGGLGMQDEMMVVDEEEDDGGLEAELERELGMEVDGEDDGGGVALPKYVAESSSESEEE